MSNASGLWEEDPGVNRHFILYAATSGTGGTFSLNSDIFYSPVTRFVIPKGMTLKVWSRLVSGPSVTVSFQFAPNGSSFVTLVADVLSASGEIDAEKRRSHVFRSGAGTEAIQVIFTGANNSTPSNVTFDCELTQD